MFFYNADAVGNLIALLRTVDDDIRFLKSVGVEPTIADYPTLQEKVFKLLFTTSGDFTQHVDRVEKAGYIVCKIRDRVYLKMQTTRHTFMFEFPKPKQGHVSRQFNHGLLLRPTNEAV